MFIETVIESLKEEIAIIGSGVVGSTAAWHLSKLGYRIVIIDPKIRKTVHLSACRTGTNASLGVLMCNTFQRTTGRAWLLRQQSKKLWSRWINQLNTKEFPISFETPLIKLATSEKEELAMQHLINTRKHLKIEALSEKEKSFYHDLWPNNKYGGMVSREDGRIDPFKLQESLYHNLKLLDVEMIEDQAINIHKIIRNNNLSWAVKLENFGTLYVAKIIICAAYNSNLLLKNIGYKLDLEAILGQAVEIEVELENNIIKQLPPVLNIHGINIIPKTKNHLIIGATIEKNNMPNKNNLEEMMSLGNNAPTWFQKSKIVDQWYGFRAKPRNRPAPVLEKIEQGLILATGHNRNGILLAPASADFIAKAIKD